MSDPMIAIRPLDPVGAEVTGLEGLEEFSAGMVRALNQAWWHYGILLFRNVRTAEQHIALSRCFGELEMHPLKELRAPKNPPFFPLGGNRVLAQVFDDTDLLANRIPWHRDTAFTTAMCMGAMLRMVEAPDALGETLIGDTAAAYDALPDDLKQRVETLEYRGSKAKAMMGMINAGTWWKKVRPAREDEYPPGMKPPTGAMGTDKSQFPEVEMPVVIAHPETGRKCLFISPMNVDYFLGIERDESDELLEFLVQHMTNPKFVYKHRWSANDALIWDNRRCIHAAFGNHPTTKRRALRTTLAARFNVGRYAAETPSSSPTTQVRSRIFED